MCLVGREADIRRVPLQDVVVLHEDTVQHDRNHRGRLQLAVGPELRGFPINIVHLPLLGPREHVCQRCDLLVDTPHHTVHVRRVVLPVKHLHFVDALQEDAAVALHLERVLRPRLWSLELDVQLAITEVLACLYRPRARDDDNRPILYLPFRIDRSPVFHRRAPLRQVLAVEQHNGIRRRLARLLGRHHFGRFRRIPFRTLWGHMPTFLRCRGERHAAQCAYQ